MACCLVVAQLFSWIYTLFRHDARSVTDPDVLQRVMAMPGSDRTPRPAAQTNSARHNEPMQSHPTGDSDRNV